MANTNISVGLSGTALSLNKSGNNSLNNTGSFAFAEALTISTGAWTQVCTGSQPASVIYVSQGSASVGSLNIAISASGVVNSLGTIGPANGTSENPCLIQWNGPFTALFAQAVVSSSNATFVVAST